MERFFSLLINIAKAFSVLGRIKEIIYEAAPISSSLQIL
jgi:hypothetical protein